MFALILGLRPPRYFASLLSNTYCLNIGKINPLKHYVLSISENIYELNGLVLTKINIFAMRKILLASASPRRKEILRKTGLNFSICTSDYKEDINLSLKPRALAKFLSRKKAETVAHKYKNGIIIAADTFIVCKNRLLGKPHTDKEAESLLPPFVKGDRREFLATLKKSNSFVLAFIDHGV